MAGLDSPGDADALALTFAERVAADTATAARTCSSRFVGFAWCAPIRPAVASAIRSQVPAVPGRAAGLPPRLALQASGKIADGRQGFCAAATHSGSCRPTQMMRSVAGFS